MNNEKHCSLPILKFKKMTPPIGSLREICTEGYPQRRYFLRGEGRNVWLVVPNIGTIHVKLMIVLVNHKP